MFDVTNIRGGSTTVNFNSVSGTLVKSCPESKFARFHSKSELGGRFFDNDQPFRIPCGRFNKIPVVVLQVMLCGDGEFLIEYMDVKDD